MQPRNRTHHSRAIGVSALAMLAALSLTLPVSAQAIPVETGPAPSQDVIALAPDGVEIALEALPALIADIVARSGIPGVAVAVVHKGETVFAQGFGVRELGKDTPIDADTVFQIASMSKPLSGTIGAIQVSAGVAHWDDLARDHLPDLALSDDYVTANATIGDFYAHRTGLPMAAGDDLEDIGFDRAAIIERLRLLPLDSFRTSYHYANFGITIGAEAIAAASGQSWEDLAEAALFTPLGMSSTSFRHDDYLARENRAVLHALQGDSFRPLFDRDPDAQAPAGGASSSVNDLAEWLKLLLANGEYEGTALSTPEALLAAMSPQAFSAPPHAIDARAGFYGYGFNVTTEANGRTVMGHSGAFVLGGATNMRIVPSADLGIVVLTNAGPVGAAEAIATQFIDIAQYGQATRDWYAGLNPLLAGYQSPVGDLAGQQPPADPAPARPLADYAGSFDNAYFGPARIEASDSGLVLVLGPAEVALEMTHWTGDSFAVSPSNENAPYGSQSSVTFTAQGDAITGFTVEYLDGNGMAHWTR